MQISNLLNAEFKTLVISMFKELIVYFNCIKKTQVEMKFTLSEIIKNLQGTNREEKETGIQTNDLEYKEVINIQPNSKNKKESKQKTKNKNKKTKPAIGSRE